MKLRNKKTGKILELAVHHIGGKSYESLAEIEQDWEDVPEEPKEYWFIRDHTSIVGYVPVNNSGAAEYRKEIGNYFDTREEAEKAVEKLKAYKRLKDKGFRFEGWWYGGSRTIHFRIDSLDKEGDCLPHFIDDDTANDLDLLFGGKE